MALLHQDDEEHPIPGALHEIFRQLVDAFVAGDWELQHRSIDGVAPIAPETARDIQNNIFAYGSRLAPLDPSTWERSCYRWMDGHWEALVDLTTAEEAVSDLTLHADIHLDPLLIEVRSAHVP